jgi:hypothetical protein
MGVTSKSQVGGGQEQAPGMRRGDTQDPERHGVWVVDGAIQRLGWFFREQFLMDYGIDAQAEVVADDDRVAGQLLAMQIKGGNSWFSKPYDGGWTFYGDSNHLAYWLGHSLPVVVIVNDDGNAFWEQVTSATARETPQGFALKIPSSQPLDKTARDKLLAVAGRSKGLTASLPDFYAVLPPAAVGPLERATGTDRLAAARLAERLAAGRSGRHSGQLSGHLRHEVIVAIRRYYAYPGCEPMPSSPCPQLSKPSRRPAWRSCKLSSPTCPRRRRHGCISLGIGYRVQK